MLISSQAGPACNAVGLTLKICRNSTTLSYAASPTPETYWGQFEEISKYNVHLNFFERLWAAWYAFMGNDVLATGILSFTMHELVYFGRSLPWIIIDCIPALNKYKIQNVSLAFTVDGAMRAKAYRSDSKKFLLHGNNGVARSWFLLATSLSSYHRSGPFLFRSQV